MNAGTDTSDGAMPIPVLVERALDRLDHERSRAYALPHDTYAEHAVRAARLAVLFSREERWWGVLATSAKPELHSSELLFRAVEVVAAQTRSSARFWRESAIYWEARAEGLSDAEADRRVAERFGSAGRWSA
jgi:hypothetical protein